MKRALLVILPVCLLAVWFLNRQMQQTPLSPPYKNVEEKWKRLKYTPIDSSAEFAERLAKIPIHGVQHLDGDQERKLRQSIFDMLTAFRSGSYDAYRKFRTPIDTGYGMQRLEASRQYVRASLLRPGEQVPDDPEALIRLMWERMDQGGPLSNIWHGVSLEEASVDVRRTVSLPPGLMSSLRTNENLGFFTPNPHFVFLTTPQSILSEHKDLLYATVSLVVEHAPPDPPYANHIRYYWDPKESVWLPWEFTSAYSELRQHEILW